jgi:glucan 1,3-beta-glucosidase
MFSCREYLISSPLVLLYYTELVGDAKEPPTLKAAANFNGIAVLGETD